MGYRPSSLSSFSCIFVRVRVLSVFRLTLPFQVCLRLRQSVLRIPLHGDVIAVNHVARLMTGDLHDMLLRDACQGHIACGGTSEVVEVVIGDSGFGECLLPGATKVPNGLTLPMKDPGSLWMSGEPGIRVRRDS
jgi:hypothetical protein